MQILPIHGGLQFISALFSYPEVQGTIQLPPELPGSDGATLLAERAGLDPMVLENEYVRLFINAMPEISCAPYGSVYLEGSVLGASTLKVAAIYRKYGMESEEPADHIAVECEFLAWLQGRAVEDASARKDFDYLLGHLRQWTEPFFKSVEQHDRLGYFRSSAELARSILATTGLPAANGPSEHPGTGLNLEKGKYHADSLHRTRGV